MADDNAGQSPNLFIGKATRTAKHAASSVYQFTWHKNSVALFYDFEYFGLAKSARFAYLVAADLRSMLVVDMYSGAAREFTLHDSENLFPENLQAEHNAPCSFISDADDRLYFLLQTETIFFWCFQLNFEASTYTFACKHSLLDNRKYWSLDDNKLYALHEDGRSTDCYEIAESINFARDTRFFLPKSAYGTALRQWCFFDGKLFIFSFCTEYERNTNATKMETLKTICYWLPNDRHTHSLSTLPLPDSFLQLEAWANEKTEENVVREIDVDWQVASDGNVFVRLETNWMNADSSNFKTHRYVFAHFNLQTRRWKSLSEAFAPLYTALSTRIVANGQLGICTIRKNKNSPEYAQMPPISDRFFGTFILPLTSPLSLQQIALFAARRHKLVNAVFNAKHASEYCF